MTRHVKLVRQGGEVLLSLGAIDDKEAEDIARIVLVAPTVRRAILAGEDSVGPGNGHYTLRVDCDKDGERTVTFTPAQRVFR